MTEYLPPQQPEGKPEVRVPSDDQLKEGFYLGPEETVAFDITPSSKQAKRGYDIGNGVEVTGQVVAEVRLGGDQTYATGMVINIFDAPGNRREDILVIYSPTDNRRFSAKLVSGEMRDMGRDCGGQDMLPDTVSRNHCAIGMDSDNRLIIENHNPTNFTAVRRIG